jgi:hypothetical protein
MKKLILLSLSLLMFVGCLAPATEVPTSNNNIKVELLFEHEGVKVYRFYDGGVFLYYAVKSDGSIDLTKTGKHNKQMLEVDE